MKMLVKLKKKADGITQSEDKSMKLSKLSVTTEYAVQTSNLYMLVCTNWFTL